MRILHPNRPAGEVTVSGITFTDGVAVLKSLDDAARAVLTDHGFTFEAETPRRAPSKESK